MKITGGAVFKHYEAWVDVPQTGLLIGKELLEFANSLLEEAANILDHVGEGLLSEEVVSTTFKIDKLIERS